MCTEVKTLTESGTLKVCPNCGQTILLEKHVTRCPLCNKGFLSVDDSVFENGEATRMALFKSDEYEPDKLPASLRKESTTVGGTSRRTCLAPIISMYPARND